MYDNENDVYGSYYGMNEGMNESAEKELEDRANFSQPGGDTAQEGQMSGYAQGTAYTGQAADQAAAYTNQEAEVTGQDAAYAGQGTAYAGQGAGFTDRNTAYTGRGTGFAGQGPSFADRDAGFTGQGPSFADRDAGFTDQGTAYAQQGAVHTSQDSSHIGSNSGYMRQGMPGAGQNAGYGAQDNTQAGRGAGYGAQDNAQAGQAFARGGETSSYTEQNPTGDARKARHTKQKKAADPQKGHMVRKVLLSLSLGLLFGIFAGAGFVGVTQAYNALQKSAPVAVNQQNVLPQTQDSDKKISAPVVNEGDTPKVIYTSQTDVTSIVKKVMPAMVSITNNYTEVTSFWGQTYKEDLSASGSGIIVARTDDELLIVSNQHVVAEANQLLVTLDDGTEVEAKIKGTDKDMDLAVVAININDLSSETLDAISVASLGDSDELELGEQVIAIGNALGYGQSVTVGYISALDRKIDLEDGSSKSFIQTDAAINPGNSGGALLNAAGEVIGINSNKIGGSSIEGMGYAIPITTASPIIADLMERQTRNKVADGQGGYLGISYQEVTDDIANMFGMPKGVYVASVYEGSGADAAGIKKGDVIVKFDGESIDSFNDLQDILQYFAVGDTANVTVMRSENGEYVEHELQITLGERPNRNRY